MSGFTAVGVFLISIIFSLFIFSLWTRIALRYLRVSTLNPFNRLIQSITNPFIEPFIRLFKLKYKPGQKYDWVAFIFLIAVECLKIICLSLLVLHGLMPFVYLLIYVLADLIVQPCNLIFYAILIRVIMSYVNPRWENPIADFIYLLTRPFLGWGRKIVPNISGFDFSPFIIMIILQVITLFINASLPWRLL